MAWQAGIAGRQARRRAGAHRATVRRAEAVASMAARAAGDLGGCRRADKNGCSRAEGADFECRPPPRTARGRRAAACMQGRVAGACMHAPPHQRALLSVLHKLAYSREASRRRSLSTPPIWRPWLPPPASDWLAEPSCSHPGRQCRRLWWPRRRRRRCCHGAVQQGCARLPRRPAGPLRQSGRAHPTHGAAAAAVGAVGTGRAAHVAPCGRQLAASQQTTASCASTRFVQRQAWCCAWCGGSACKHSHGCSMMVCWAWLPGRMAATLPAPLPLLPPPQAIASAGVASRRAADELVFEGKVRGRAGSISCWVAAVEPCMLPSCCRVPMPLTTGSQLTCPWPTL